MTNFDKMLLVAGATMLFASPALAGPGSTTAATANAKLRAQIVEPLTLTKKQDLDFGTLVKTPALTAAVTVQLDNSGALVGGCPAGLLCSGITTEARFEAFGTLGQNLYVYTPVSAVMTNAAGNTLTFTPNARTAPLLLSASTGLNNFGVGGSIDVSSATAPGVYNGAMNVTVDYN